jgi:hypothetical protein
MSEFRPTLCNMDFVTAKEVASFLISETQHHFSANPKIKSDHWEQVMEKSTIVAVTVQDEIIGVFSADEEGVAMIHVTEKWQHLWQVRSSLIRGLSLLLTKHEQLFGVISAENEMGKKICEFIGARLISSNSKESIYSYTKDDLQSNHSYHL